MNERIKKLAEQLAPVGTIGNWGKVRWSDDIYPQCGDTLYADIDLEKFAQLIVKECMGLCVHETNDDDFDDFDMGMYVKAEYIKKSIKQHFGVK